MSIYKLHLSFNCCGPLTIYQEKPKRLHRERSYNKGEIASKRWEASVYVTPVFCVVQARCRMFYSSVDAMIIGPTGSC